MHYPQRRLPNLSHTVRNGKLLQLCLLAKCQGYFLLTNSPHLHSTIILNTALQNMCRQWLILYRKPFILS